MSGRILVAIVAVGILTGAGDGAAQDCQPSAANPIAVCFDAKPLTLERCASPAQLIPHVAVRRMPDATGARPNYAVTYQLITDGAPGDVVDPYGGRPAQVEDTPILTESPIPFHGEATYALRITVTTRDGATASAVSDPVRIVDHPNIYALVIGISHYDHSTPDHSANVSSRIDDLRHADADAEAFGKLLRAVLPSTATIDVRTSHATPDGLSRDAIFTELTRVRELPDLCGDNDWFIFYFSGHGIVGAPRPQQKIYHYLSTKPFDPADMGRTAISLVELLDHVSYITAKNELIVLDSCFSGAHIDPVTPSSAAPAVAGGRGAGRPRAGKVEYVFNGRLQDPIEIAQPAATAGDSDAYRQTTERLNPDRRALFLTAAGGDHEAEEGFVEYRKNQLSFTRSYEETDEQTELGHGVYTFAFLSNLLSQLPAGSDVSGLLPGAKAPQGSKAACLLDFGAANTDATSDMQHASTTDMQRPDVAGRTTQGLPKMACSVPDKTSGGGHAPHK